MSKQFDLLPDFATFSRHTSKILQAFFKLTCKDSGYKGGPLPKEAMDAFGILQNSLTSEPVIAFPRADHQYTLITEADTGTADTAGGLGAILTQKDEFDNFYTISYASRQLKDHKKITLHSYWKQLLLFGVWTFLTNI
jgi:hypothetical protein